MRTSDFDRYEHLHILTGGRNFKTFSKENYAVSLALLWTVTTYLLC